VVFHGEQLEDDYHWLRDRSDAAVARYLEGENAYAEGVLAPLAALEADLYREMLGRIQQTDLTVPYRRGEYWYYQRTEEGKQYPIYCRKRGSLDGTAEEILVDLNLEAVGHSFCGLGALTVSPDGSRLAYSIDHTGFREYTLRVIRLADRVALTAPIEQSGSAAWAADNETLFYTLQNAAKRDDRLLRLRLGSEPELVFEEPDERFRVWVTETRSRRYLVAYCASHLTTDAWVLRSDRPADRWETLIPRIHDREYDLDDSGDGFLVRINDRGRNFRVVRIERPGAPETEWTEIVPHRDDRIIEGVECFERFRVTWLRIGGLPRATITLAGGAAETEIGFPEAVYDARPGVNPEWTTETYRYQYESFVTPTSVYQREVATGETRLLKQKTVLGGYDPARYRSERLEFRAADGTAVPVSLVRLADAPASTPVYLTGYGAYGISYPIGFSSNRFSLIDRGVTFAVAHVRGGGELGRSWHDAGRMDRKETTFADFVAVADGLIAAGRTSADRLVIEGGSAGGLLIGAVLNARPDLAAAAILQVPFVDVLNTMADPTLPLTVGEYEEWGNPTIAEQYRWMRAYCPYTNLRRGDLPALLVRGSLNDSQVMYWEPAKYVARLRTIWDTDRPLLLITNLGAGHGGASGRYDRLKEIAVDYAFVLWRLGLASGTPA